MRPPWRSTIFLHTAKPIPVPGYSSRVCKRWKMTNIRSAYWGSMPIPLSFTENSQSAAFCLHETWICGALLFRYLMPLPIRF